MSATLMNHSEPVARTAHQCSCCHQPINAGAKYVRQSILDDGFWTYKAHLACHDTLMDYMSYHAYDGDEGMPNWDDVLGWVADMESAT